MITEVLLRLKGTCYYSMFERPRALVFRTKRTLFQINAEEILKSKLGLDFELDSYTHGAENNFLGIDHKGRWIYCKPNGDLIEYKYSDIASMKLWMPGIQKYCYIPNNTFNNGILDGFPDLDQWTY